MTVLAGCSSGPVITGVQITGPSTLYVGDSATLTAAVKPVTASQTVVWKSSDTSVLTVDPKGKVAALKPGTVKVTATAKADSSKSDTLTINVGAAGVTNVAIDQGNQALLVGDTASLTATVSVNGNATTGVTWSSSDTSIATVASTGSDAATLTGVAVGSTTITATSTYDTSKKASITVTVSAVPAVTGVTIDQGNQNIVVGNTASLTATVTAAGGADTSVTWSSSDTSIATLSSTGPDAATLTAVAPGTVTVTATSVFDTSQSGSITVTVSPAPAVTSVTINEGNQSLVAPNSFNFTATVAAVGGASQAVTWSSDNTSVATVASTGPDSATVHAVYQGTAHITATSQFDNSKSNTVTVTVRLPPPDLTNIYVDASANPGGNGSSQFPFQTINAGISAVNATGTVHVLAGNYPETLYIDKALTLSGAGIGSTTITADGDASTGAYTPAAIEVANTSDVTLAGFTLSLVAGTSTSPTNGISAFNTGGFAPDNNINVNNVSVQQGSVASTGVVLLGATNSAITNTDITITQNTGGAGIVLEGGSYVTVHNVTTTGHNTFAGMVIYPNGSAMSNITVTSVTFNESNKLEWRQTGGGSLTKLNAPQFIDVVLNQSAYYTGYWYYKETDAEAISNSLFNFPGFWQQSYIQVLDTHDQSVLTNTFIAGSASSGSNVRANVLQAAVDAASPNATLTLMTGPAVAFDGQVDVTVSGLTINGAGSGSTITRLTAATAPTLTVDATGLTVTGVEIDTADTTSTTPYTVLVNQSGFSITGSNLATTYAVNNASGAGVTATTDWWGDALGPNINGGGPGGSSAAIVTDPVAATLSDYGSPAGTAH